MPEVSSSVVFWCWTRTSCLEKLSIRRESSQSDLCVQWGLAPESHQRRGGPLDTRRRQISTPSKKLTSTPYDHIEDDDDASGQDDQTQINYQLLPLKNCLLKRRTIFLDEDEGDETDHISHCSSHSLEAPINMDDCLRALRSRRRRR